MLDRIKQTTATVGTGTYTLDAAAAAGFRTLRAASVATGGGFPASVPYLVTSGVDWEVGYGTYNGADPGTVVRDVVLASSNAGAAVDWPAGEKAFVVAPGTFAGPAGKQCGTSSYAPESYHDSALGYTYGSLWLAPDSGAVYVCHDPAVGFAVWKKLSHSPWRPNAVGAGAHISESNEEADNQRGDLCAALVPITGGSTDVRHNRVALVETTINAPGGSGPVVQIGKAGVKKVAAVLRGTVIVRDDTGGSNDSAMWTFEAACRTAASTNLELVGTPTVTLLYADASLSTTDFDVLLGSGSGHTIRLAILGVAGLTLQWSLQLDMNEVFRTI